MSKTFDPTEITNQVINSWLEETRGLPVTLQLSKLGFKVIEALESAYHSGLNAAGRIATASRADEQGDYARELPSDQYCVTCGQEYGTALRKDGKYYCSRCWQIWNS